MLCPSGFGLSHTDTFPGPYVQLYPPSPSEADLVSHAFFCSSSLPPAPCQLFWFHADLPGQHSSSLQARAQCMSAETVLPPARFPSVWTVALMPWTLSVASHSSASAGVELVAPAPPALAPLAAATAEVRDLHCQQQSQCRCPECHQQSPLNSLPEVARAGLLECSATEAEARDLHCQQQSQCRCPERHQQSPLNSLPEAARAGLLECSATEWV